MKHVLDLYKTMNDAESKAQYNIYQFDDNNDGEKHILFVASQLSSKHLYRYILPFFCFYDERIKTAITDIGKYDQFQQIMRINPDLDNKMIQWADFIVFPFTTQDLSAQNSYYAAIREVNPNAVIVFSVDFNFRAVPEGNPYHDLFKNEEIINAVDRNILYCDLCLTTNLELDKIFKQHYFPIVSDQYQDNAFVNPAFATLPYLIDPEIVTQNIDFEDGKLIQVIKGKDIYQKVHDMAEEIKSKDLNEKKKRGKKVKEGESKPKKVDSKKATAVKAEEPKKRGRRKKDESIQVTEEIEKKDIINKEEKPSTEITKLERKFKVGIICSPSNIRDLKSYNQFFKSINEKYGDQIRFILIGYDPQSDKLNVMDGVNYEYVKQMSIIHYFKLLRSLELDFVFIPLENNPFNVTSENYNKYLECSLFNIPVLAPLFFPYNRIIQDNRNGFLYTSDNLMTKFEDIICNHVKIKVNGMAAYADVTTNHTYSPNNINFLSNSIYNI